MFGRPRPGHPFLGGAPVLVAHRGGAGLAPENTMVAFRQALDEWDSDMLEMDVRLTADGQVVVLHDGTVDRTTDGTGPVREMAWEEVRQLDAGYRFRDSAGEFPYRGQGVRIPLFDEVLEELPHMRIMVEPKSAESAGPLVEVIRARGAEHRILIGALFERTRDAARGYGGPWGASRSQVMPFWLLHRLPLAGRWYVPAVDAFQVPETSGALPGRDAGVREGGTPGEHPRACVDGGRSGRYATAPGMGRRRHPDRPPGPACRCAGGGWREGRRPRVG